jgi:hypothetical protein
MPKEISALDLIKNTTAKSGKVSALDLLEKKKLPQEQVTLPANPSASQVSVSENATPESNAPVKQDTPPLETNGTVESTLGIKLPKIERNDKPQNLFQRIFGITESQPIAPSKTREEVVDEANKPEKSPAKLLSKFDSDTKNANKLTTEYHKVADNISMIEKYPFMKDIKEIGDQLNAIGEPKTQEQIDAHNALVGKYNALRDTPLTAFENPDEGSVIGVPDAKGNQTFEDRGAFRKALRGANEELKGHKTVGDLLDANNAQIKKLSEIVPQLKQAHTDLDETKNNYQKAIGYEGKNMGGWESFGHSFTGTLDAIGDHVLPADMQKKVWKDRMLHEQLAPKEATGVLGKAGEIAGGLAPYVAGGILTGGESWIAQAVTQGLLGGASSGGATGYETFKEELANGKSEDEAMRIANKRERVAGIAGGLAFGSMGLVGGKGLGSVAEKAVYEGLGGKVAEQTANDAVMETLKHQGAIAGIFGADKTLNNLYANYTGAHKDLSEGVVESMITPVLIGAAIHGAVGAIKLGAKAPKAAYDVYTTYLAKTKPEVMKAVAEQGLKNGESPQAINKLVNDVESKAKAIEQMPPMPFEELQTKLPLMQQRDALVAEKSKLAKPFHEEIDLQIAAIDEQLKQKNDVKEPEPTPVGNADAETPKEDVAEVETPTKPKVEFADAKNGDGVEFGGEKWTVTNKTKTRGGRDVVELTRVVYDENGNRKESTIQIDKEQWGDVTANDKPISPSGENGAKPIRQLGTGANVYFETDKYRVNDRSENGKVILNVGDANGLVPLKSVEFDTPNEAVFVAKKLQENAPEGLVSDYHNVDKIIENYKKEYADQLQVIQEHAEDFKLADETPLEEDAIKHLENETDRLDEKITLGSESSREEAEIIDGLSNLVEDAKNIGKREDSGNIEEGKSESGGGQDIETTKQDTSSETTNAEDKSNGQGQQMADETAKEKQVTHQHPTAEKPYKTKSGNATVHYKPETRELVVESTQGKEIPESTKKKYIQEYKENYKYDSGKDYEGDATHIHQVIDESNNPSELADILAYEPKYVPEDELDFKERAISNNIGYVSRDSYVRNGDANNIGMSIAKEYLRKDGTPLDVIAMDAEMEAYGDYDAENPRITEQDVIDFMHNYPSKEGFWKQKSETYERARNRFKELTGFEPTEKVIKLASDERTKNRENVSANKSGNDANATESKGAVAKEVPETLSEVETAFQKIEEAKRSKKTVKGKEEAAIESVKDLGEAGEKALFVESNFKDIIDHLKSINDADGNPILKVKC